MRTSTRTLRRTALAPVAALVLLPACGGSDGGEASSCGPDTAERVDASSAHLLDAANETTYLTDPPTSGPHVAGAAFEGALDEPISRPEQVGALEGGQVLLQHRDLDEAELAELEALVRSDVVVAPNPDLPDRVVATSWAHKMTCEAVDVDALRRFVDDHVGRGDEH